MDDALRNPWNVATVTKIDHADAHPEGMSNAFIQWKGTNVCFDFWCECGTEGHFDGYFAYAFTCPKCHQVYEFPFTVYPLKVAESVHTPVVLEVDDDE